MPKKKPVERPTKAACMLSFCHQCQDYYLEGKKDCDKPDCPLYVYMPYHNKDSDPDYSWQEWNPKRIGFVKPEESARGVKLTEEQLEEIAKRAEDHRELKRLEKEQAEDIADDEIGDWGSDDEEETIETDIEENGGW